ncbi:MAG: class I SAM-dependent methyltransferase [Chloroflexi bacterium]|nr:class I SAM-dependent methyltransferase [Chloroflexota bacterium]
MRLLLRAFFRLLYNEFAFTYDLVSWTVSVGQWREWQRQAIPFIVGETVLEVAHGTGDLQIDLAAKGYKPVAFDLSPYMGQIAKKKLARHNLFPPFVRGSVTALPFPSGHFTTIVSTFPAEFIVHPEAVREFKRVLASGASGGRMIFVPAATIIPGHIADRLAQWLFEVTGQSTAPEPDGGGWPPRLTQAYQAAGFEIRIERVPLARSLVWVVVAESHE